MNLIVGGTGFVGGHLAEFFFEKGEISRGTFRKGSFLRLMDQCGIQCMEADLLDSGSLHEPLEMVDVVYNLASPTPANGALDYLTVNTTGLGNLLRASQDHGVKTFVHLSTLDVYGFRRGNREVDEGTIPSPGDPYQKAKFEAENLLRRSAAGAEEMRIVIVRAARALGPRDTTLALPLMRMISGEREVVLPSGSEVPMSFTHPKDIARALLGSAASSGSSNGRGGARKYMVKSFDASFAEIVDRVILQEGVQHISVRKEGIFSRKKQLPRYTVSQIRGGPRLDTQGTWGDISYSPSYDMSKTVDEIVEWYRRQGISA